MTNKRSDYLNNKVTGLVAVLLLAAVIISPAVIWQFKPAKKLEVAILDKTVPQSNYREHKGLVWLLNNSKYVKDDGNSYTLTDYYGFFPGRNHNYQIKDLPSDLSNTDMIYVADTYGVYYRDYYGETKNLEGERSPIIYGGTKPDEVNKISTAMNQGNKHKTLVVEFNTLASPTDAATHAKLSNILGVHWTGWIGRQFTNLKQSNEEIPRWVFRNYEKQYNTKWNFKGKGYVFVKNDDTLVVLEQKELGKNDFWLEFTKPGKDFFNISNNVGYYYWFDMVKENPNTQALANFHFDLKPEGAEKFSKFGLPTTFPAVAVNKTPNYTSYYFAGDFADKNNFPVFYEASGLPKVNAFLTPSYENQDSFFWKVYTPMMQKIFADVYKIKKSESTVASAK
jgi:hypothetical protein